MAVGDSLDPATQIGPMATRAHLGRVKGYIEKGRSEGGRITTGGGRPEGRDGGWFVSPTVFADVNNSDTIAREEIFGPVLSVIRYDDDADAVRIANESEYGLGGTVWSSDPERARGVASRVNTGTIGINRSFRIRWRRSAASSTAAWAASSDPRGLPPTRTSNPSTASCAVQGGRPQARAPRRARAAGRRASQARAPA